MRTRAPYSVPSHRPDMQSGMSSDWHVLSLSGLAGGADSDPKRAKRDQSGGASGSWTVSPTELREALSGLGKAAIRFELSEMHDASEVRHHNLLCFVLSRTTSNSNT